MKRKILIPFLALIMLPVSLQAHPHMFIDMVLTPVFSEKGFEGTKIDWLFDMVFTGSVLMDNGIGWKSDFSDSETEIIRTTSFENLINYNYFTYFNAGGSISRAASFSGFSAYMKDNRLGYRFFLPYEGRNADAETIRIAVYDETFFCDIAYAEKDPVAVVSVEGTDVGWELSEKKDAPIFYDNTAQMVSRDGAVYTGQAFPVELVLRVK